MSALDRAQELLRMEPLPADAEAQLAALEAEAPDEDKPYFAGLWEALFVLQNS